MVTVKVDHLRKTFDSVMAVNDISFEAEHQQVTTLLGPSGCGKTTTVRCIAGLEEVDGGEIFIGDELMSSPYKSVSPDKRNIGMVFQSYAVWPHMTVYENVVYGLKARGFPKEKLVANASRALSLVRMSGLKDRPAIQLSGGEQQRVALARAIAYEPSILLLDEPLSNLDAKLRESTRFELVQLQRRLGLTSIYVTHDQAEAMVISDRIVVMNGGRIAQIGTPREIYTKPSDEFVANFIGVTNFVRGKIGRPVPDGADRLIELENGVSLRCATVDTAAEGSNVLVSLRPEKLRLLQAQSSDACNVFQCQIVLKAFLGDRIDYRIAVMGKEWRVETETQHDFPEGAQMYVKIEPGDLVVISNA
jgi:iron(III) transport system ATP-binding protein